MKKNGFTLIELIITIALLGIVGIVISVNMIKIINDRKVDDEETVIELVEEAACTYVSLSESNCSRRCTINASTLVSKGLIDENINGIDTKKYSISVTYVDGEKTCKVN